MMSGYAFSRLSLEKILKYEFSQETQNQINFGIFEKQAGNDKTKMKS